LCGLEPLDAGTLKRWKEKLLDRIAKTRIPLEMEGEKNSKSYQKLLVNTS